MIVLDITAHPKWPQHIRRASWSHRQYLRIRALDEKWRRDNPEAARAFDDRKAAGLAKLRAMMKSRA